MNELTYQVTIGDIFSVSKDAIDYARKSVARDGQPVRVRFIFNEIEVLAYSSSYYLDVADKYMLQSALRRAYLGYAD